MARHSAAEPPKDGSMTTAGEPWPTMFASIRCRPASTIVVRTATLHDRQASSSDDAGRRSAAGPHPALRSARGVVTRRLQPVKLADGDRLRALIGGRCLGLVGRCPEFVCHGCHLLSPAKIFLASACV